MVAIEEAEEDPSTKWIQVPLSPGDSNLGLVEMNPRVVDLANTSGQNINSEDLTKVEEILKTSRSVPLFQALKSELEDILEDGTKNNQSEVQETKLAKMCMIKEEKGLLKYSVAGEEKGLKSISPTPHKVQFLEDEDSRIKYSRSAENIADSRKLGKCSPSKSLCGSSRTPPTGRRRRRRQVSEASSMSVTSVTSESSVGSYSSSSPDGGYGWVVVAASFLVNMIADGVTFSFGVMFDEFQGEFDSTKAETAGVVAIFHAVPLLTGPLATWLTDRYGCRKVTIVGAILACIGFLLAAFSHHIALLYLFFGVIAGFGLSLCYVAAIIIVAYYFDRRRSFATGISVCGSGVGTFLFAPLTQYLMDEYNGWRGACIILAGIFLNMCFCGMLFRELPWTKEMKGRRKSFRSISEMPEIGDLRSALEDGEDLSGFLYNEEDEPRIANSLIDLPTYVKNAAGLPPDVLSMLARNKKTYTFIQQNFPDSLIATSISEYGLRSENGFGDKKNDHDRLKKKEESTSVKLALKVSSLLKKDESRITRPVKQRLEFDGDDEISTFPQGGAKPRDGLANASNIESEVLTNRQKFLKTHRLKNLRMRRQSLTCKNRIAHGLRSSSCPDILNPVLPDIVSEPGYQLFKYLSFPFLLFCLSNSILYFWYDVPYVYTIVFAETRLGVTSQHSTHIISIIGILNTIGEVIIGWIGDQTWVSSHILYAICMILCAVSTALMPLVESYPILLGLSAMYGFCISANYSLTSPILVDLVSIERFSSAYGFLLASQGVANLIGPPFAGWLYDYTKEWFLTFGMAGLFIGGSGVLLLIIPIVSLANRINQNKEDKRNEISKHNSTNELHENNGCVESAVSV